ncbi:MAG: hypothetical protein Q9170_007697 [Blastenia crenularia]
MAFPKNSPFSQHLPAQEVQSDLEEQSTHSLDDNRPGVFRWLSHEVFRKDCLDRKLERHHITGIAFSAAVGIGLFSTLGEIIALGGPVGALLAFVFAGLVIVSVMRCLAEMVSVRPVTAPLIDFPHTFVDEALGFSVGIMYWSDCRGSPSGCVGKLHEYGDSNHSRGNVHTILEIGFHHACGDFHPPCGLGVNERMRCEGKISGMNSVTDLIMISTSSMGVWNGSSSGARLPYYLDCVSS